MPPEDCEQEMNSGQDAVALEGAHVVTCRVPFMAACAVTSDYVLLDTPLHSRSERNARLCQHENLDAMEELSTCPSPPSPSSSSSAAMNLSVRS